MEWRPCCAHESNRPVAEDTHGPSRKSFSGQVNTTLRMISISEESRSLLPSVDGARHEHRSETEGEVATLDGVRETSLVPEAAAAR